MGSFDDSTVHDAVVKEDGLRAPTNTNHILRLLSTDVVILVLAISISISTLMPTYQYLIMFTRLTFRT